MMNNRKKRDSVLDPFLRPRCGPFVLDGYVPRSCILRFLTEQAPSLSGTLLDIGCGISPYRSILASPPSQVDRYLGIDMPAKYYTLGKPDLRYDGVSIPLKSGSVDCILLTEVLEHVPDIRVTLSEAFRVLRPGGRMLFTCPFIWPLHDVPDDHCRYTPFALETQFRSAGFRESRIEALGGYNAALAQMIALWVTRSHLFDKPRSRDLPRKAARYLYRFLRVCFALPIIYSLYQRDVRPAVFGESAMINGLCGVVIK